MCVRAMLMCLRACVHVQMCMRACLQACRCACVPVCMCACVHVCMCACVPLFLPCSGDALLGGCLHVFRWMVSGVHVRMWIFVCCVVFSGQSSSLSYVNDVRVVRAPLHVDVRSSRPRTTSYPVGGREQLARFGLWWWQVC